jgi:hypothetical protein
MTTYNTTWLPVGDTGTNLYNAVKKVSDGFTAVGVLLTADTGQIDLTSISSITPPAVAPVSTFVPFAFEIRKISSPGKPDLYCRIDYAVYSSIANNPSGYRLVLQVNFSTSTNGAGTLNGVNLSQAVCGLPASTTIASMTTVRPLYIASDGQNYLTFINDPSGIGMTSLNAAYMNFGCERSIDALTGAYDGEAFIFFASRSAAASGAFQVLNFVSANAYASTLAAYQIPAIFTNSGTLTTATIMPATIAVPTPKGPATVSLLAYNADVSDGAQYVISMYGVNRNYICSGQSASSRWSILSNSNARELLRYD